MVALCADKSKTTRSGGLQGVWFMSSQKTCLIVDDSSTIRKIIRAIFQDFNFSCGEAEDGQVALDKCLEKMPDIIMLDWNMPVMNGIEFLKKLRATPGGDAPIVIFCTTESDMSFIEQALSEGANDYVMKPFDKDMLGERLMQLGLIE
jgi:two-component system chemotaxis response regulator CheY